MKLYTATIGSQDTKKKEHMNYNMTEKKYINAQRRTN